MHTRGPKQNISGSAKEKIEHHSLLSPQRMMACFMIEDFDLYFTKWYKEL